MINAVTYLLVLQRCNTQQILGFLFSAGHEAYGQEFYQPNRILVLVKERLDEERIKVPITAMLTETVIDVSTVTFTD